MANPISPARAFPFPHSCCINLIAKEARNFFPIRTLDTAKVSPKKKGITITMENPKTRWRLAAGLFLSLGLAPLVLAQEKKSGGMIEGEHMMEQKSDAMKGKGAMKDMGAMKDQGAMKDKGAVKDKGNMKDAGGMKDDMGKMEAVK